MSAIGSDSPSISHESRVNPSAGISVGSHHKETSPAIESTASRTSNAASVALGSTTKINIANGADKKVWAIISRQLSLHVDDNYGCRLLTSFSESYHLRFTHLLLR